MRNIRLFIKGKNLDMLKAFSDESYLYNYIVNNYSELPEDNIFKNPTFLKRLEEMVYLSKDNISLDDEMVWKPISHLWFANHPKQQSATGKAFGVLFTKSPIRLIYVGELSEIFVATQKQIQGAFTLCVRLYDQGFVRQRLQY